VEEFKKGIEEDGTNGYEADILNTKA